MNTRSPTKLERNLSAGNVYRRDQLTHFTTAIDRDLASLVNEGLLEKIAPGLYYKPRLSRFGALPPNDKDLVKAFLRDDFFLIYSWNDYNALGLGLTQLYNKMMVYNRKRHGLFKLSNREYDFRRPTRGFPDKLTREFLLVDLLNNLKELDEDPNKVKEKIKQSLDTFNKEALTLNADLYGKIATQRFLQGLI